MFQSRSTRRQKNRSRSDRQKSDREPVREPAVDAMTIAWTASVSAVLLADLVTIAAHFYAESHPEAKAAFAFEAIMLLTASLMGVVSLALLVVVWRVSRLKPPQGFVVFATLVAAAPILVTIARLIAP